MNPILSALTVAAAGLLAAADDKADPKPPAIPAPDWVKMIDQGDNDPRLKGYKTPEGIKVEIVAEDPAVVNPAALAFSDDGTLYVLEYGLWRPLDAVTPHSVTFTYKDGTARTWDASFKRAPDPVKVLTDSKGTGVYDRSKDVLGEQSVSDMVLHDGWLYIASEGAVRRYKQSKPNGPYDVTEVVAQGFGGPVILTGTGIAVGPDHRLYVASGGSADFVEGADGKRSTVIGSGAIFRCRPDGSGIDVYAIGFTRPSFGTAFDAVGNLFQLDEGATDESGNFKDCRLIHVVEGADFGWCTNDIESSGPDPVRATARGDLPGRLAPMLRIPRGATGSLLIYNDTRFPEPFRGLIMAADHAGHAFRAYRVEAKGATFAATEKFDVLNAEDKDFLPNQAVVGPDGAIYLADRRNENHGRILRLTWAGANGQLALPPRPMDSWAKLAELNDDNLISTLSSEDGSIRDHARQELVRRGAKERPALLKLLKDADQNDLARIAALWALESMWDGDVQAAMMSVLGSDSNRDLRRLAADALGLNATKGDSDVHAALLRALNEVAPEVRRYAALAMSHVAADGAADNLVNTWAFDDGRDAYLRDGIVRAIENLGKPGVERLIALGESGSEKDWDKMVQALTMMRTRPGADAIPQALQNPHLNVAQRAALIRSYENYLLDPLVSLAPMVDYLLAHPDEAAAVKQAGAEVLAAGIADAGPKAARWVIGLMDEKDGNLCKTAVVALSTAGASAAGARQIGQAFLDGKLPPETKPRVEQILRRCADKDVECARMLEAIGK